ncbi:MAG: helix-turn-helix transcriptional regulator [Idiomarina sp.]|nr:helix-turn-helix transcriptional regulator [Idiomarina sp.]
MHMNFSEDVALLSAHSVVSGQSVVSGNSTVGEWLIAPLVLLPVNVLQISVIFCCVLMAAMIWPQPRLRGLLLLLGWYGAVMLFNFLEETGLSSHIPSITPIFSLLLGPVFYLLIRRLVCASAQYRWRDVIHVSPALVLIPFAEQVQWVLAFGTLSQLVYLVVAAHLLRQYQQTLWAERSDADRLGLQWLFWLLFALVGLLLVDLVRLNLQPYLSFELRNQWYFLHSMLGFGLICLLVLRASRQQEFFDGFSIATAATEHRQHKEDAKAVFGQLSALIEQQKLFMQPRLAVADLAELTGLSSKDVSWAINQGAGVSFCDYINQLRLAEVQRQLQESRGKSILEIALDAGFNSKSTFNALFKANTGLTPKQYQLQKVQNPDSGRT